MILYFILFLFGLLGLAIQSFVKINMINERTPDTVNFMGVFKQYFRQDFPKIGISVLAIIAGLAFVHGYLNLREAGGNLDVPGASAGLEYKLTFFLNIILCIWGYVCGSFVMAWGSKAERLINKEANKDLDGNS
jgi:hypothetical protein